MNSQLYGAISATDIAEAPTTEQPMNVGGEEDDPEIYSEEDVLAGDIITTDEVMIASVFCLYHCTVVLAI